MKTTLAIIAICFAIIEFGLSIWAFIESYQASKLWKKSEELQKDAERLRERAERLREESRLLQTKLSSANSNDCCDKRTER